jgi:hypothetical protein
LKQKAVIMGASFRDLIVWQRAFDYNYDVLAAIPQRLREERESAADLSAEEIGWIIHDELLMLWLVTYPWPSRCLRECRISGDSPNIVNINDPNEEQLFRKGRCKNDRQDNRGSAEWSFRFSPQEVPLRRPVRGPLPQRLVPLLELYLKYRRHLVRGKDSGTLFLSRTSRAYSRYGFSDHVCDITDRLVAARVPPGAFRDVFSYHWLDKHPGQYAALASILWKSIPGVRCRFDRDYRAAHPESIHAKKHYA